MTKNKRSDFRFAVGMLIALALLLFFLYLAASTDADGATVEVQGEYIYGRTCTDFDSMYAILSWQGTVERDTLIAQACSVRALVWVDSVGWYQLKKIYWIGDGILVEREWVNSYYTPWTLTMNIDSTDENVKAIGRYAWTDAIIAKASRIAGFVDSAETLLTEVGATAVVDSAEIARSVWDPDIVAEALRTIGNAGGAGSGGIPCTLFVYDTLNAAAVHYAIVRAMNTAETSEEARLASDANGRVIFNLAAETYHIYTSYPGLTQIVNPETVTVAASGKLDTIEVIGFDAGSPPDPGLCRVYGYIVGLSGLGVTAWVEAASDSTHIVYDGMTIWEYAVRDTADSDGYWYLDLFPSDSIGSNYEFSLKYGRQQIEKVENYDVPDSTTHWFTGQ